MRKLMLPMVALALLSAGMPARANVLNHLCTAASEGTNGERLLASLAMAPDRSRLGITVNWYPAQRDIGPEPNKTSPDLGLSISYLEVGENGPSYTVGTGIVVLQVMSPPDQRQSSAKLRKQVAQYRLELVFDNGPASVLAAPDDMGLGDLPLTASRAGTFEIPLGTQKLKFNVYDGKGKLVRSVEFDLSQPLARDKLYHSALDAAQKKSADLANCQPIG